MPVSTSPADGPALRALPGARLERLREQLARAPFDALLLTSPEAVGYATGYRSVAGQLHAGHRLAALVTADDLTVVLPAADTAAALDGGLDPDRVVGYGRFEFAGPGAAVSDGRESYGEALDVALARTLTARWGVEGTGLSGEIRALVASDGRSVTQADVWMTRVRAVKLPGEQALLCRAAELAEAGIEAALAVAATGVTERELAAHVASTMAAGGGVPRFVVVTAGERSGLADAFPTDRRCRPGDLLRFDVGCLYEGYWSDIARSAVLGPATPLQQSRYDALLEGLRAELTAAVPGATAGEVFDAAVRAVTRHGIRPYRRHHAGHAIGLSVYEQPLIAAGDATPLETGMVFCFETPYYEPGWGGMMVEDTGVVTEAGFSLFTSIDRSLRVVPA